MRLEKAYSDVVREAQEIVELSLKGMLRAEISRWLRQVREVAFPFMTRRGTL